MYRFSLSKAPGVPSLPTLSSLMGRKVAAMGAFHSIAGFIGMTTPFLSA
jgi:hypothetical protein